MTTLDDYMAKYGAILAAQATRSLEPLHVPNGSPEIATLLRDPFPAQANLIAAGAKALRVQKSLLVVGECGIGKTLVAQGIVETHARGHYRALVFCPGQLAEKWEREILSTVPDAKVFQLRTWKDVLTLKREPGKCWYIITRDRAKLGAKWRAAFNERSGVLHCPGCGEPIVKPSKDSEEAKGQFLTAEDLSRAKHACPCGEQLWQFTHELNRYEPAKLIHKRFKGLFDYFICDEFQDEKSSQSAQGAAMGSLAASCKKVLALSGTLIGGYVEHLRPLLFRLCPASVIAEGFAWDSPMPFSEKYGRIETRITEGESRQRFRSDANSMSRGSRTVRKLVRPGIMPTVFGRHLINNAVFLGLDEVSAGLPDFEETLGEVRMDAEIAKEYLKLQNVMSDVIKSMVAKGSKRFLGAMLQTLLGYPDRPYGWGTVGFTDENGIYVPVCEPKNFPDLSIIRPKERALLDLVDAEVKDKRQLWVYTTMSDTRDVTERLAGLCRDRGHRATVLHSSVDLGKREAWIERNGPKNDVIISHPKLVETGLDLFAAKHNFATLPFYLTGYNLFTLRQASRRAWRIGQKLPCKVKYFYYAETMQARAMSLMGRKLAAAEAIEGKFSSDGLVALGGDDGIEMALAKSLAGMVNESPPARSWVRIGQPVPIRVIPDPSPVDLAPLKQQLLFA